MKVLIALLLMVSVLAEAETLSYWGGGMTPLIVNYDNMGTYFDVHDFQAESGFYVEEAWFYMYYPVMTEFTLWGDDSLGVPNTILASVTMMAEGHPDATVVPFGVDAGSHFWLSADIVDDDGNAMMTAPGHNSYYWGWVGGLHEVSGGHGLCISAIGTFEVGLESETWASIKNVEGE